ncbi:MAG: HAD family hydrolase [Dermatophilaceae bacterium]
MGRSVRRLRAAVFDWGGTLTPWHTFDLAEQWAVYARVVHRDYHRGLFERDGVLDLIDADVYSSEIAWTKPHPKAFHASAEALGVEPSEAVYVGGRPFEDVHGSQLAGMRAIWVPHSEIPVAQQVSVDVTPDGVAHELLDVLDIVDGWRSR